MVSLAWMLASQAQAAKREISWGNNVRLAAEESRKTGKPILAAFIGSDWCPYCEKLNKEIFETRKFANWSEKVILLQLDFPKTRPQDEELKQQNELMRQQYRVEGMPTVLFIDGQGNVIGRTGYMTGGAEKWLEGVDRILADAAKAPAGSQNKPALPLNAISRDFAVLSLGEAIAAAKQQSRPLLIVGTAGKDLTRDRKVGQLLDDTEFRDFVKENLVIAKVHLATNRDEASAPTDLGLWQEIQKKHKLPPSTLQLVLVSSDTEKMLVKSTMLESPKVLINKLMPSVNAHANQVAPASGGSGLFSDPGGDRKKSRN